MWISSIFLAKILPLGHPGSDAGWSWKIDQSECCQIRLGTDCGSFVSWIGAWVIEHKHPARQLEITRTPEVKDN